MRREILARDREMDNDYTKDLQVAALRQARSYLPDKIIRVAAPHKLTDPKAGPMIAVRLSILTRKTLGGLEHRPRLAGARGRRRSRSPGLYAAGEVAGFGGGGVHGYRVAGRHVPRRVHLQRASRRPRRGVRRCRLTPASFLINGGFSVAVATDSVC